MLFILLSIKLAVCKYGNKSNLTFVNLLKSTFNVKRCVKLFNDDISLRLLFDKSI